MRKYISYTSLLISLIGSLMIPSPAVVSIPTTAFASVALQAGISAPQFQPLAVKSAKQNIPQLNEFVSSVITNKANEVVGIYIPGVLALPVGQQPRGNAGYVTRDPFSTTQFNLASQYNTIGILAHNDLAGKQFYDIYQDQYAIVVYGDGALQYYQISEVQKYQALSPTSTFSEFVNLDGTNERLSASQLFNRVYSPGDRLVFQTCIEANGEPSWGRMFIIANPAGSQVLSVVKQTSFLLDFASLGMASR